MEVMAFGGCPFAPREDIDGGKSSFSIWEMIVNVDSIVHSHGPEGGVCRFGPSDSGMEKHGTGHGDDGTDASFGDSVCMVGPDSGESGGLAEL
jgi:hypothetical protein